MPVLSYLIDADQAEAVGSIERLEIERRRACPARLAIDNIGPSQTAAVSHPDDQVTEAVPVDVAGVGYRTSPPPISRKPLVPSNVSKPSDGVPAPFALPNTT